MTNLRSRIREPGTGGALAGIFFVLAIAIAFWRFHGRPGGPPQHIYIDMDSGQLFVADANAPYPVETPAGTVSGVRAFLYTCRECSEEDWFVAHLERINNGQSHVRLPTLPMWYRGDSDKGQRIQDTKVFHPCPGGELRQCKASDLF